MQDVTYLSSNSNSHAGAGRGGLTMNHAEYLYTEDGNASPWLLDTIKPIQLSRFNFEEYLAARQQFTEVTFLKVE